MHITTFDRRARLAGIAERAPDGCASRVLEIGVFENDHRIFSTELENDGRQVFRGHFGHAFTSPHAAGEHDLVDAGVDECRAGGAVASDDLEQTVGQLSLFEYASDLQCGEWSKLARFDDYCIARHQRHDDFVERSSPREIPRRDDAGDAERFVDDVRRAAHQVVLAETDLAWVEQAFSVLGEVMHQIERGHDLHRDCFGDRLAGFARDESCDLFELGQDELARTQDVLRARAIREPGPCWLCGARSFHSRRDFSSIHQRRTADLLAG